MEKVKLGLNYALMLEAMRVQNVSDEEILSLLKAGDPKAFMSFGEGIPDWETLIEYFNKNEAKIEEALTKGYEFAFLTKGALKSLLELKYGLKRDLDYKDCGSSLEGISLSKENINTLQSILSKNWELIEGPVEIKLQLTN